jgi:hypothetical protein
MNCETRMACSSQGGDAGIPVRDLEQAGRAVSAAGEAVAASAR